MTIDRLLRRFLQSHPDSLTDEEILELLLRFTNPEAQTVAKRLKELYPSISALMEADPTDLSLVEGMNEESLLLLRLVPVLHRRYFLSHNEQEKCLLNGTAYGRYLLPHFMNARDEEVWLLLLDASGRVLNCRFLGQGTVGSASVPMRRLVQEALTANASGIVLAHNHPCGLAVPSKEDLELTYRIRDSLSMLELDLLDHIIVADDDFVSLRESGYLQE